jgi:alkylation response protein AidB-like acyl-CoA dehydrogenase
VSGPAAPDLDDLVGRAGAIAPDVAAGAAASDEHRRLPPSTVEAMHRAGMFQLLTPSSHGGLEAGLRAQVETLLVIGEADPAAGWVQMVSNAHVWMVGSFPPACQAEVFADGPSVVVPGTLAAQGRATRVDEGWRLSGRWQFASGVDHGDWLMMGAVADERLPESGDRALHVIVPKADVIVDDTWFTLGLRGSGSKDLLADDVFVPDHRAMATRPLFDGVSPHGEGNRTHANRLPVLVCLSTQLAAAVVGLAAGALRVHVAGTADRRDVYTGAPKAAVPATAMRIAESTTELDLAHRLVRDAADRCDRVAATGQRLPVEERAELKWHAAYCVELCRRAIERVFAASGAHGVYDDSILQARFRDLNTACHHAIVDLDGNAELYGRVTLGLDPGTPLV